MDSASSIPFSTEETAVTYVTTKGLVIEGSNSAIAAAVRTLSPFEFQRISFNPWKKAKEVDFSIDPESIQNLPTTLNTEQLQELISLFQSTLSHPQKIAHHLKDLDRAIERELHRRDIFHELPPQNAYLLDCKGFFFPGPPPLNYVSWHKGRILNDIFLERQYRLGLNSEHCLATFDGELSQTDANLFISNGHLFKENAQNSVMLLHGKYVHCLGFEILWNTLQNSRFAGKIDPKGLLCVLIETKIILKSHAHQQLWNFLIDNSRDLEVNENADPKNYIYSGSSPILLYSLIMCFGKELVLPHLQTCLLENHWKSTYRMIKRIITQSEVENTDDAFNQKLHCCITGNLTDRMAYSVFTNPLSYEISRYQLFSDRYSSKIVRKTLPSKSPGKYASMVHFMESCDIGLE